MKNADIWYHFLMSLRLFQVQEEYTDDFSVLISTLILRILTSFLFANASWPLTTTFSRLRTIELPEAQCVIKLRWCWWYEMVLPAAVWILLHFSASFLAIPKAACRKTTWYCLFLKVRVWKIDHFDDWVESSHPAPKRPLRFVWGTAAAVRWVWPWSWRWSWCGGHVVRWELPKVQWCKTRWSQLPMDSVWW